MAKEIDARGLACPQPVILTKKALETESGITVRVDNDIAMENVKRLGANMGCTVTVTQENPESFRLDLTKPSVESATAPALPPQGPLVVVIGEDRMGRGSDELGYLLIRSFVHTLLSLEPLPGVVILFNTGVKLAVRDSDVLDDLQALEAQNTKILVCGTCTNFFGITQEIAAGSISNMYDIVETMSRAGRIIAP